MFNLEAQISTWRRQMLAAEITAPVPLEELEAHLREDIDRQVAAGTSEADAFEISAAGMGPAAVLKGEFACVRETIWVHLKENLTIMTGLPNPQLATNMNTIESNQGPRWSIYTKAGTFIFPAAFLWLFTVFFVLPKANEICQAAGMHVFDFTNAPAVFRGSALIGSGMIFLTHHLFIIGGATILGFVLLERYSRQWPHYRKPTLNAGVFLLNALVLLSLTMITISILVAAPALLHRGH